jgi:hypothetical protein
MFLVQAARWRGAFGEYASPSYRLSLVGISGQWRANTRLVVPSRTQLQGRRFLGESYKYLAIAVETWLLSGAVSALRLESDANARRQVMPALTERGCYLQCRPAEKGEVRDLQDSTDSDLTNLAADRN